MDQPRYFIFYHVRLLEEGNVAEAEKEKVVIENLQRERRKHREATKEEYRPFWFK